MNDFLHHSTSCPSSISTKLIGFAVSHAAVHHVILMPPAAARNVRPPLQLWHFSHVSMDSRENMSALVSPIRAFPCPRGRD